MEKLVRRSGDLFLEPVSSFPNSREPASEPCPKALGSNLDPKMLFLCGLLKVVFPFMPTIPK